MENMTKPSVISIVPIELFTKDNLNYVKNGLEKCFGSTNKDEQTEKIQKIIESSFSFAKDDFEIVFLNPLDKGLYIEKLSRKVEVTLKILLATLGTSLIFVAIYEPKCIPDEKEELFKTMEGIREYHNRLIKNLSSKPKERLKDLVSYIKCIEKSCKKVSRKNCKKISRNSELWDLARPGYTFTFFYLPDSEKNPRSNKMLKRARELANAPKEPACTSEELADTQSGKGENIKFDNECAVYANWSKLCIVVSGKVAEEKNSYLNNVVALQIVLQMLWNRSDCFSNLIYKIVRKDLNRKKCFSKRNSEEDLKTKKILGTRNIQKLYLIFLTAKTNMESIASATASSKNLKLLEPFIETSRINAINTKLKNHMKIFKYQVLTKSDRKYQRTVQAILIFFAVFTAIDIVFDLQWLDLNSRGLAAALSGFVAVVIVLVVWVFKSSRSVKTIQKL